MLLPSLRDRADYVVRFLFGSFIAISCFLVVWPFATAMSVAAVIAIVSWPLFKRVRKEVGGRNLVATLIMVSLLAIRFLLAYVRKHDFTVFGWYRIALGLLVLGYFYLLK